MVEIIQSEGDFISNLMLAVAICFLPALVPWLLGKGLRYVFSGY
jgi:hypothetical protein